MAYVIAWIVIWIAGACGAFCLVKLTRHLRWPQLRLLLRWLIPVLLLAPAPVPGFAGAYAPAFLVAVFEWLFQRDGDPTPALWILLAAVTVSAIVVYGVGALPWLRRTAAHKPVSEE